MRVNEIWDPGSWAPLGKQQGLSLLPGDPNRLHGVSSTVSLCVCMAAAEPEPPMLCGTHVLGSGQAPQGEGSVSTRCKFSKGAILHVVTEE